MNAGTMRDSRVKTQGVMCLAILERTLHAVFTDGIPADAWLRNHFRNDRRIGSRDRRLYGEIVFAVLRWFGPLREAFEGHSHAPEWYALGGAAAEGLADPVCSVWLETAGVNPDAFAALMSLDTPLKRLDAFLSLSGCGKSVAGWDCVLPDWVREEISFPVDETFGACMQKRPPLWLRVQGGDTEKVREQLKNEGVETLTHPRIPNALMVRDSHVNLLTMEAYRQRRIEVQDLSSQCIGLACAPSPGECWWDACAGGGGKSLQLAFLMIGKGLVTATDIRPGALEELRKRAGFAKLSNVHAEVWDGTVLPEKLAGKCDGVLVDAPCSSSGRWRRNPDARWTLTPKRLRELNRTQAALLEMAQGAVKPGGVLVYATCSLFECENRGRVELFLKDHPEFSLEPFANPITGTPTDGTCRILPQDADCDASFTARFRKDIEL